MLPEHKAAIDTTRAGIQQVDLYGRAMRGAGEETRNLGLGLRQLGGVLVSISIMSFVANLIIRRLAHAKLTVTEAQERYNKALRDHGPLSEQAITAERRLGLAHMDVAIANREALTQTVLYGLQVAVLSSRILQTATNLGILTAAQVINTVATSAAIIKDAIQTAWLWVKAHALMMIKYGLVGAAIATAGYITATTLAISQTRRLAKELGQAPSFGLVKSLEDVGTAFSTIGRRPINFTSSIVVNGGMSVEGAIEEQARRLKDEYRRRVPD